MTTTNHQIEIPKFFEVLESMAEMSQGSGVQMINVPEVILGKIDQGFRNWMMENGADLASCFSSFDSKTGTRRLSLPGVWRDSEGNLFILFNFGSSDRSENIIYLRDIPGWILIHDVANVYEFAVSDPCAVSFRVQVHSTDSTPKRMITPTMDHGFIKEINRGSGGGSEDWSQLSTLEWQLDSFIGSLDSFIEKPMVGKQDGRSYTIYLGVIDGVTYRLTTGLGRSIAAQLVWGDIELPTSITLTQSEYTNKDGTTISKYAGILG